MKTILAALIAGIFLCSTPAFAADKPAEGDKAGKKDKKDEGKKDEAKKEKAGGGGGW